LLKSEQIKKFLEKEKFKLALEFIIDNYIKSSSEEKQRELVTDLTKICSKYPNCALLLIELAKVQDELLYEVLFNTLCDIIIDAPELYVNLIPLLIKELKNQSVYTRIKQVLELIRIKSPRKFINVIMDKLKDKEDPDRWRYILELGNFGVKFPEVNDILIPYLTKLLNDENEQVRAAATDTLEKFRTKAPIKPTVDPTPQIKAQANKDKSGIVRDVAKEALNNIEKVAAAEEIVEEKVDGIKDISKIKKYKKTKSSKKQKKAKR